MCEHNDQDDYLCDSCCEEVGYEDGLEGDTCEPPYKDFHQCDSYYLGYSRGLFEYIRKITDEKVSESCECGSCEDSSDHSK
jgi:hypothetical protein